MEVTIRRFGNSLGITFPAALVRDMGFGEGSALSITATGQTLVLEPKPRHTRAALLALCDPSAPLPEQSCEWEQLPAVGSEIW